MYNQHQVVVKYLYKPLTFLTILYPSLFDFQVLDKQRKFFD